MNSQKKKFSERIADKYASFITRHPFIILVSVIVLTIILAYFSTQVKTESMNYRNILPDTIPVIYANNVFEDNFGTTSTLTFAIELDPQVKGSTEYRDVRNPEVLAYIDRLETAIRSSDQVSSTQSGAAILKSMNNGIIPKDAHYINELSQKNGLLQQYISADGTVAIIIVNLVEDYDDTLVVADMREILETIPSPDGIKIQIAGQAVEEVEVNQLMSSDMAKTSQVSMIGIILILLLSFWSIKYGLTPLTTIIIGVIWTMGFIGLIGLGMNTATSGVISMIMGIGIDFGIQVVNRFRQELRETKNIDESMKRTMEQVLLPMFITTLAAVIGFKAMSMGQLTILADMGNMMAYGVIFCFLVAITVVPVLMIFIEHTHTKLGMIRRKYL